MNSVAILIRIISGFLTSKAIAIFVGAEGMALIGNLRDFLSSAQSVSTLGSSTGVVKYVSEFKNKTLELTKTVSTAFYLFLFSTFLVSLYCYFDAQHLSAVLFDSKTDYSFIIKIVAVALPFYGCNAFLLAVINGLSQFKRLLYINIFAQLIGMCITLYLIWQHQLTGALIAVATVESLIIFATVVVAYSQNHVLKLIHWKAISFGSFKNLGAYSVMALFTALTLPLIKVAIRNHITETQSLHDAGLWEAMNRLSWYYLMFVSTLLSVYLLPRFSEIQSKLEWRKEVFSFYKTVIPIFGLGLILIYFFRVLLIKIVFTSEFAEVESLFFWQLLGDFLKVLSIVIAYQFLAKKMFWSYIITEALSMLVLYFASIYFIDIYGAKGATIAHFVDYAFYLVLMLIIFWKSLFGTLEEDQNPKVTVTKP